MRGPKPVDPRVAEALAPLLEQAKAELRADLARSMDRGASAWGALTAQRFEDVSARLRRLEQRTSKKR